MFANFLGRDHYFYRWYDEYDMRIIYLNDSIARLCRRIGALSLLTFNTHCYRALTCEFFATLAVNVNHDGEGDIHF